MKVTHTPGPWEVFETPNLVSVMKSGTAAEVVHWSGFDSSHFPTERLANAKLIAAAPMLYLACEFAASRLEAGACEYDDIAAIVFELRCAIALTERTTRTK